MHGSHSTIESNAFGVTTDTESLVNPGSSQSPTGARKEGGAGFWIGELLVEWPSCLLMKHRDTNEEEGTDLTARPLIRPPSSSRPGPLPRLSLLCEMAQLIKPAENDLERRKPAVFCLVSEQNLP